MEQDLFQDWMGTSILYESLSRYTRQELPKLRPRLASRSDLFWRRLLDVFKGKFVNPQPEPECHICVISASNSRNALDTLLLALQTEQTRWLPLYDRSDGLCLTHLRMAIIDFGARYPIAVKYVLEKRLSQLETQTGLLNEYIRKHIWQFRSETKTKEELSAWRQNLAFFTGYPPDSLVKSQK